MVSLFLNVFTSTSVWLNFQPDSYKLLILSVTFHLSLCGCSCNTLNNNTNTYNVGCSNVHLIMVLLCLGCPWNLSLILNLWKGNNVSGAHTEDKAAAEHRRDEPGFCFTASDSAIAWKIKANFTYNAEWLNSVCCPSYSRQCLSDMALQQSKTHFLKFVKFVKPLLKAVIYMWKTKKGHFTSFSRVNTGHGPYRKVLYLDVSRDSYYSSQARNMWK